MAIRDVILLGVLVFTIAIGLLVIKFAVNTTMGVMINSSVLNESNGTIQAFQGVNQVTNRFDYIVFVIFIGLILGVLIASWFAAGNPIFTFIYIIVIVLGVAFSTVLTTVWETITDSSVLGTQITNGSFTITNGIMLRLPMFLSIIGFIGLVIMFAKPYFQEGEGE